MLKTTVRATTTAQHGNVRGSQFYLFTLQSVAVLPDHGCSLLSQLLHRHDFDQLLVKCGRRRVDHLAKRIFYCAGAAVSFADYRQRPGRFILIANLALSDSDAVYISGYFSRIRRGLCEKNRRFDQVAEAGATVADSGQSACYVWLGHRHFFIHGNIVFQAGYTETVHLGFADFHLGAGRDGAANLLLQP